MDLDAPAHPTSLCPLLALHMGIFWDRNSHGQGGSCWVLKRGTMERGQPISTPRGYKGELDVAAFVSFPVAVVKCSDRSNVRERWLILLSQPKGTVHHNGEVKVAGI